MYHFGKFPNNIKIHIKFINNQHASHKRYLYIEIHLYTHKRYFPEQANSKFRHNKLTILSAFKSFYKLAA